MESMRLSKWVLGVVTLLVASGCASGGPNLYQLGPDALYERGVQEFESKRWNDAIRAFEQIVQRHPMDPRIEEVRFLIGSAYFEKKDYVTAAAEFVRVATDYPRGEYAEEARFKTCEAYFELSPRPQLDQEYTQAAIEHCGALLDSYPTGEYAERTRELVDDLHGKLAEKVFLNGEYYLKRRWYDSAIIYFEDVITRYPSSRFTPRAMLRLVEVYGALGYGDEMESVRSRLEREYPDSEEARLAGEITLVNGR